VPELSPRDSLDRVNQYSLHSAICTAHCFLIKTISQPTAPAELSRTLVQHRAGHGPRAAQSQSRLRPGRDGRKEMKRAFLMMSIVLATAVSAFASATGSITGTVTDKTGSVIPGAAVDAVSVETGVKTTTRTNAAGSYAFPDLPVGHYNLQITAKGFSAFQETGLVVDVN